MEQVMLTPAEDQREKARIRAAKLYHAKKHDPEWMQTERERHRLYMAKRRADPEYLASRNARRRELAKRPEVRQAQSERMKDWKSKNSEKVAAYQKQWREENAEHVSNYSKAYMAEYTEKPEVQFQIWERNLWKNYKMTSAEFNELWTEQDGQCAICEVDLMPRGRKNNSVSVDHNHENGSVRGLLCQLCNRGIGALRDNPKILQSAAAYLENRGHYGSKPTLKD